MIIFPLGLALIAAIGVTSFSVYSRLAWNEQDRSIGYGTSVFCLLVAVAVTGNDCLWPVGTFFLCAFLCEPIFIPHGSRFFWR
jgi:multisubunit Na+/H+ antiporter MnhG subunit